MSFMAKRPQRAPSDRRRSDGGLTIDTRPVGGRISVQTPAMAAIAARRVTPPMSGAKENGTPSQAVKSQPSKRKLSNEEEKRPTTMSFLRKRVMSAGRGKQAKVGTVDARSKSPRRLSAPNLRARTSNRRSSSISVPAFLQATSLDEVDDEDDELTWENLTVWMRFKLGLYDMLESKVSLAFLNIATIYALFSEDTRILAFPKDADAAFEAMSTFCFFVFLLEIVFNCIVNLERDPRYFTESRSWAEHALGYEGYPLSFYFSLDILACVSMVFDMPWLLAVFDAGEMLRR